MKIKARQIKFRAWEPLNGKMHYMNYCLYEGTGNHKRFALPAEDQCTRDSYTIMNLDALTVMQFTGLIDTNGQEIYENDILIAYWHNGITIREKTIVQWNDNGQWNISQNRINSRGHVITGFAIEDGEIKSQEVSK